VEHGFPYQPATADESAPKTAAGRRSFDRVILATAAVIVAGAVGALLLLGSTGGSAHKPLHIRAPSLVQIDAHSATVVGDGAIADPQDTELGVVSSHHEIWVLSHRYQVISIIDARTDRRTGTIGGFGGRQTAQSAGYSVVDRYGSVWVAGRNNTVIRINPATHAIERTIPIPGGPTLLAAGFGRIWVLSHDAKRLWVIYPGDNDVRLVGNANIKPATAALAVGAGAVWVGNYFAGTVTRVDPTTGKSHDIYVGLNPTGIGVGFGSVWVSNNGGKMPGPTGRPSATVLHQTVTQINPVTGRVVAIIPVGNVNQAYASDIAPADGSMWVTCPNSRYVARIDPHSARVIDKVTVPFYPVDLTAAYGQVWVTVQQNLH
jgi:streptogramin lyase